MRSRYHAIIIGGGFSGTALALQLIKRGDPSMAVTLLEAGQRLCRGLAYDTSLDVHLLNTRAEQMSVFHDDPEHFVRWRARNGEPVAGSAFVTRRSYGDYLEDTLIETIAEAAPGGTQFTAHLQSRAIDVARLPVGFEVTLDDGRRLIGNAIVMATGHELPADPLAAWLPSESRRYVRNPWNPQSIEAIAPTDSVLLIGAGLTMIDVTLALAHNGHEAPIHALSRHGLLPRAHGEGPPQTLPRDLRMKLEAEIAGASLRGVLQAVRRSVEAAAQRRFAWPAVIDALRPVAPHIWASLGDADRRRFARWLRPYWDVHRHRMAPQPAAAIAALQAGGGLEIRAGHVSDATEIEDAILVTQQVRSPSKLRLERYAWVINCTGPNFAQPSARPFERRLIERGMLVPDALGLGYLTTEKGVVLGSAAEVSGMYLLGPACRPRLWECTAVPELRSEAAKLADELLGRCAELQRPFARMWSTFGQYGKGEVSRTVGLGP